MYKLSKEIIILFLFIFFAHKTKLFLIENYHKQLNNTNYMNNEELKLLITQNCIKFLDNIKEFTDKFYVSYFMNK